MVRASHDAVARDDPDRVRANRSRSAKPSLRANASKIRRTTASLAAARLASHWSIRLSTCRRCASVNANRSISRRASAGSSCATAASSRSRCGAGSRSCRRSEAQEAHGRLIGHRALTLLDVDTYLAIASRRDQRRYLPDPLDEDVTRRILDAGAWGSASNRQPWTFVVERRDVVEALASTVFAPDNVLGAGLVVAVVVAGKGLVSFDAGRAAQNMLLAAWNEGLVVPPGRDHRPGHRARDPRPLRRGDARDRARSARPERPLRSADAHGRRVERPRESPPAGRRVRHLP